MGCGLRRYLRRLPRVRRSPGRAHFAKGGLTDRIPIRLSVVEPLPRESVSDSQVPRVDSCCTSDNTHGRSATVQLNSLYTSPTPALLPRDPYAVILASGP